MVDNNEKFRESLKLYIERSLNHCVVGEVSNIKDFQFIPVPNIDVIIMDIKSSILSEFHSIDYIKDTRNGYSFIALSQHKELADVQTLLNAGFKGFVSKEFIFRDLEKAIDTVTSGRLFYPKEPMEKSEFMNYSKLKRKEQKNGSRSN